MPLRGSNGATPEYSRYISTPMVKRSVLKLIDIFSFSICSGAPKPSVYGARLKPVLVTPFAPVSRAIPRSITTASPVLRIKTLAGLMSPVDEALGMHPEGQERLSDTNGDVEYPSLIAAVVVDHLMQRLGDDEFFNRHVQPVLQALFGDRVLMKQVVVEHLGKLVGLTSPRISASAFRREIVSESAPDTTFTTTSPHACQPWRNGLASGSPSSGGGTSSGICESSKRARAAAAARCPTTKGQSMPPAQIEAQAERRSLCQGSPRWDSEFCFLQLRRVVELVAFSAMKREEGRYRRLRELNPQGKWDQGDAAKDWQAKEILGRLVTLSPHALPIPIKQIDPFPGPQAFHLSRTNLAVNHGRLVELYEKCGGFMHAKNPLAADFVEQVNKERVKYDEAPELVRRSCKFLRKLLWTHAVVQLDWTDPDDPKEVAGPMLAWIIDFGSPTDLNVNVIVGEAS
ncbi:hypothetical protein Ddc_22137 [Ditylenchus destructor]|nr:hypothetical protein Ddc_22137 [Ditylenchus destructor]